MKKEAVQSKGYGTAQMGFSVNSVASVFFRKGRMRKDEKGGGSEQGVWYSANGLLRELRGLRVFQEGKDAEG